MYITLNACIICFVLQLLTWRDVLGQENPSRVQTMRLPTMVTGNRFGDPVFIPISVANPSPNAISGYPLFESQGNDFQLRINAISGNAKVNITMQHGSEPTPAHITEYQAYTIQSTVLLVHLWTPNITHEIYRTKKCTVFVELGPEDSTEFASLKGNVEMLFEGSAFLESHTQRVVSATFTNREANAEYSFGWPLRLSAGRRLPFFEFATPLDWLVEEFELGDINVNYSDRRIDPALISEANRAAMEIVNEDSKLHRMLVFAELVHFAAKDQIVLSDWTDMLPELTKFIDKCTPLEAEYYIAQVAANRTHGLPEDSRQLVTDALLQAFPTYSDLIVGERPRVRTTRMAAPKVGGK